MEINANVILARCGEEKKLYGMRVQEMDHDWIRTWAFPIKEELAHREGFDKVSLKGSFNRTKEYPGCPYCGGYGFIVCGKCKKISCYHDEELSICRWCGNRAKTKEADTLDVTGGDF